MRKRIQFLLLVVIVIGVSNLVCTKPSVFQEGIQNKPHLLKMLSYGATLYTFYYTPDNQLCSLSLYHDANTYTSVLKRNGDTLWFAEWRFIHINFQIVVDRVVNGIITSEAIYNLDTNNHINSIYQSLPPKDTIQITYDSYGNMKSITPCDSFITFLGTWEYDTLKSPFSSLPIEIRLLSLFNFSGINIGPNNARKQILCKEASHYPDSLEEHRFGYSYDSDGYPTLCTLSVVRCSELTPNSCETTKPIVTGGWLIYYY
jgi:hypothetical protein